MPLKASYLALVGGGAIVAYSGLKGKGIGSAFRQVITGQSPAGATLANAITGKGMGLSGNVSALAATSVLASDALQYRGTGYVWGGQPALGPGNWDCSSFVNWCAGHDLGLPIPGYPAGSYDGILHGPDTGMWLLWGGCQTVSHRGADAAPGDLCVWQTHMGIAIGGGQMISAENPKDGTQVSTIDGFIPELLFIRRMIAGTGTHQAPHTRTISGRG